MSESDDFDPVARSRKERKRRWRARQELTADDLRYRPGGHYWDQLDEEPPDWWLDKQPTHEEIEGPSGKTDSGPIPPEIDWSDLTAYRCKHCRQGCINPVHSEPAQVRECRHCHSISD